MSTKSTPRKSMNFDALQRVQKVVYADARLAENTMEGSNNELAM
jgi:hypothetical protein